MMRRFAIIMAVIIALGVAAYVWVDTQWFGGWGTPGYVEDARTLTAKSFLRAMGPGRPEWALT